VQLQQISLHSLFVLSLINHINKEQPKDPKPHPIFIYGVTNYKQMIENISQIVDPEAYHTKTFPDNSVKINAYCQKHTENSSAT
jgi:hypothetical protein